MTRHNPHFWFVAQTGVIYDDGPPKAPSNYYTYKLSWEHRGYIELAVDFADVTSHGLVYKPGVLDFLEKHDLATSQ